MTEQPCSFFLSKNEGRDILGCMAETENIAKKIVVGVVVLVIGTAITWYFLPWLRECVWIPSVRAVCQFALAIWKSLTSGATVPQWFLWMLIALSIILVLRGGVLLWRKLKPASQTHLQPDDFRELVYEKIKWIWIYGFDGLPINITPQCPICFYQLDLQHDARPDQSVVYGLRDVTRFWCDHCKQEKQQLDGNYETINRRVKKEIIRLLNTGEWETLARQKMVGRSHRE